MIEKVQPSLGEEGIELQVRDRPLWRMNDGDAVSREALHHPVGGVVIGVGGGDVVRVHGPGDLGDDSLQVDGAAAWLLPALKEILDEAGLALDDLIVNDAGGKGV